MKSLVNIQNNLEKKVNIHEKKRMMAEMTILAINTSTLEESVYELWKVARQTTSSLKLK